MSSRSASVSVRSELPTRSRTYPAALQQQELNGTMVLAESAPNRRQPVLHRPVEPAPFFMHERQPDYP